MAAPTPEEEANKAVTWYRHHYDKDFMKTRTVWGVIDLISQEATLHGIGHTWNNRRNFLGVFWFLTTVVFIAILIYVTVDLIIVFSQRDIQSQTIVKLPESHGLQLPSVMLCNRGFFSRRKLRALNISNSLANYLVSITGSALHLRKNILTTNEGATFIRDSHDELLRVMALHKLSFSQLVEALSYRCDELVLSCWVVGREMSGPDCCQQFIPMNSATGKCYTFYTSPDLVQTMEGEHMGFSFAIKIRAQDYPELDSKLLDLNSLVKLGLQLTFASNMTHPSSVVLSQSVVLLPAIYTTVDMTLAVTKDTGMKTTLDMSEVECQRLEEVDYMKDREGFFKAETNCKLGVMRTCFHLLCNCTSYGLDYHHGMTACKRLCEQYDYTYTTSHLPIEPQIYQDMRTHFNLPNGSDVALVTASFPKLRYMEIKLWRRTFLDFLSTLGGYTGILLGMSIVTAFEIVIFFILLMDLAVRDIKKRYTKDVHPAPMSPPQHK